MNKQTTILSAVVVMALLLGAVILAAPTMSLTSLRLPQIFTSAFAATVDYSLSAEKLPNGQFAYQLDGASEAMIPGPTIIVTEGDTINIELTNNIPLGGPDVGFTVDGLSVSGGSEAAAGGGSQSYSIAASTPGTYIYKDDGSDLVGLFGAIIVNKADSTVESYVQGTTGVITTTHLADLDKEFVLFMVGSTFWGQELTSGGSTQTALWTNPILGSTEGEIVRFHVLSIGHGHTFHLHAHRWVDPGTSAIIDTKIMQTPEDNHVLTVKAGDQVGPGDWQYHCHVFAHMEAGMHGIFRVVPNGDNDESLRGASPYGVHPLFSPTSPDRGLVTFEITDEGGSWFKGTNPVSATDKSIQLARPGDSVQFIMSQTNTVHTITSLLWPTGAEHFPMDEVQSYKGGGIVEMDKAGLYVFTCKVHPYMFGGVIVDDPDTMMEANPDGTPKVAALGVLGTPKSSSDAGDKTIALDLGDTITLVTGLEIPTGSDLALRLAATFFKATDPTNWKDYRETTYNPTYPAVPVQAAIRPNPDDPTVVQIAVTNLDLLLDVYFSETANSDISGQLFNPTTPGVGEVWVDTQFEHTASKSKPGTATAVNATTWEVSKKVSLPGINMNNPHNMWTDRDQTVVYQTQWFDNKLSTFDRSTGALVSTFVVGEAPSHVMTRTDTDDIHVALNGEDGVSEILASNPSAVNRIIPMQGLGQDPTHPHAHWMSADGQKMVTPNSFTGDTSLYGFDTGHIDAKPSTGAIPIATGMMPDSSKYYVANLLSSTVSVIDMSTGQNVKTINLLADYNPFPLQVLEDLGLYFDVFHPGFHHPTIGDFNEDGILAVGALPIQTPVSPDGVAMVTANTLSGTITIVDTSTDEVVKMLPCEPGCHGVQFGAKQDEDGGYYAYVSSKFANDLIVVDADPNGDGNLTDAAIVGKILLTPGQNTVSDDTIVDDNFTGQGGQGVLPIPVVYNGWVQNLPSSWKSELTSAQQDPIGP